MRVIRGVNVFPSQIETVLLNKKMSTNYQILVDRVNNTDTLDINVEVTVEQAADPNFDRAAKTKEIEAGLRSMLGIGAKIHLMDVGSIVRSEGKAVRVIDNRHLY